MTACMAPDQPERAAAKKIPVTVVTGFLGAGKTTLVNHILKENHGMKIAIIENEFGEVGVDDALVIDTEEEIFEMNNGCICCTVRGDLIRILIKLAARRNQFDAILIETTGLCDPAPVAQTFMLDPDIKNRFTIDCILTVVDAYHIEQHLKEKKPDGVENEAVERVAFADKILLNKVDLVTSEEKVHVKNSIRAINKFCDIVECQNSRVPLKEIMNLKAFDLARVMDMDPDFLKVDAEHMHDLSVSSVGIREEGNVHVKKLEKWLSNLLNERGQDIFRSKGVLSVAGSDEKYVFQGVHMLMRITSSDDGVGKAWQPGEKRVNRLCFIGRNLDREELTKSFAKCLTKEATSTIKTRKRARTEAAPGDED
ncbi:hypothetical protein KFL_004610130 [Klebsormidium nitens]|uniref:CobW C-terminal domain-containing protein n=1 Tax=Klebsormidium nitens TaxID=105231 RepID=A0A1Y1IL41_KLENI|nr:hypothetical protein KFL_004610130 [Klebsormidium nitens]|eukprot:GAQ88818.1 hypothetical protein KFL_004610130 [Klebsormidium nitens]